MRKKSLVEDILEAAFKNPIFGIVISLFLVGLGLYLTNKQAPVGAKSSEMMFLPAMHMFGKVSYIFSAIVLIVTGIGYAVISTKKKNQTVFFGTRRTLDDLKNLSWKEFEEYVGSMFDKMGFSVEVTGGLKDGGIDLTVRKDGKTSLVQCKNYRVSKVSLSMVRDFYGAMNANLNYEAGYFITTGIFTLDAKQFAEDKPIELIDGAKLMDYVNLTPPKTAPQRAGATKQAAPSDSPVCPKCGSNMVRRTAKKGNMAGSQFWGCSAYPKCNGTKSISS
ncbi:MAG: restriction endonuclease [Nitrospirae bacterium]|nr:restriction endonuclease [Nitrospirota bacterium]